MSSDVTNSTQDAKVTLWRTRFIIICVVAALLLVAFLVCWSRLSDAVRHTTDLDEALATEGISAVALLNEKDEFLLFGVDGNAIQECGRFSDDPATSTQVPDDCKPLAGEITHMNGIFAIRRKGSDCQTIWDGGKKLYDIHTQGSLAGKGKKCHHYAGATHQNVP